MGQGKRPELAGGGLIRSSGGWSTIKSLRKANRHFFQPAVSACALRGERLSAENGFTIFDDRFF